MIQSRTIKAKITETRRVFAAVVWPLWRDRIHGGELISTEGSERELERQADASGIDAFFVQRSNGTLIPLASRIEFARAANVETARLLTPRLTVRVRKWVDGTWHEDSEFRRLIHAASDEVSRRYLPFRTIHSLVSDRNGVIEVLFSSSVCTIGLADFLTANETKLLGGLRMTRVRDAQFLSIPVGELRAHGVTAETLWPRPN